VQQLQAASQQHLRECLPRELVQLLVGFVGLGYHPGDVWLQLHASCCEAYAAAGEEGVEMLRGGTAGPVGTQQRGKKRVVIGFSRGEKQALRRAHHQLSCMMKVGGGCVPDVGERQQSLKREGAEGGSMAGAGVGGQCPTAASLVSSLP
jgi:hypothetical protein